MNVALPASGLPAKLILHPQGRLSDDEYFKFCVANPNLRLERTAQGEIVIVPPAGGESSYRSVDVVTQLAHWAKSDGRGKTFESSVAFILPDGSALSPDAAWVSNKKLAKVPKQKLRKFPPVSPEFVVEVMSPSDRLRAAQAKMETWIANGVELGWLIDADARTVYVYRSGHAVGKKQDIPELAGEGPVAGFVLDLTDIWAGL